MIFRRRILILLIGGLLIVVAAVLAFRHWRRDPIRYENYDRIQNGMTMDEVVALLGYPHGDYSTGPVEVNPIWVDDENTFMVRNEGIFAGLTEPALGKWYSWLGDRGEITVVFDRIDMTVCNKWYQKGRRLPPEWWLVVERLAGIKR